MIGVRQEQENICGSIFYGVLEYIFLAVLVAVIASYLHSRSREWDPSGRPRSPRTCCNILHFLSNLKFLESYYPFGSSSAVSYCCQVKHLGWVQATFLLMERIN